MAPITPVVFWGRNIKLKLKVSTKRAAQLAEHQVLTISPEVLYKAGHAGRIVILAGSTYGPVDAGDGELYTLRCLVSVQIHVLKHEGEDELAVTVSSVQLLDTVGGAYILGSDDWQDGTSLV